MKQFVFYDNEKYIFDLENLETINVEYFDYSPNGEELCV